MPVLYNESLRVTHTCGIVTNQKFIQHILNVSDRKRYLRVTRSDAQ
ncbi:hypothetical protein NARC_10220 [Candidatus Nitrosocosmicus arcticus]|uniref:Uncharacterized protein n=1 Tax=Candidatus Nitrosocosmicus arcticus TaxID=2035267 RepID=A0A557SYY1_9ARCH|nr:hypothetical protein NARC_10220 [Candidatus Nitrosocosmicus arcticus]